MREVAPYVGDGQGRVVYREVPRRTVEPVGRLYGLLVLGRNGQMVPV